MKKKCLALLAIMISTSLFAISPQYNTDNVTISSGSGGRFDQFYWEIGAYNDQSFEIIFDDDLSGLFPSFKMSLNTSTGQVSYFYTTNITLVASNATWSVARTNITMPVGLYYSELYAVDATNNVGLSLARGKINVTRSLFATSGDIITQGALTNLNDYMRVSDWTNTYVVKNSDLSQFIGLTGTAGQVFVADGLGSGVWGNSSGIGIYGSDSIDISTNGTDYTFSLSTDITNSIAANMATNVTQQTQINAAIVTNAANTSAITTINSNVFFKSDASYNLGNKNLAGVQVLTVVGSASIASNLTAPTASIPDLTTSNITASGKMSLGYNNSVSGIGSLVAGSDSSAIANYAFAQGSASIASAAGSFAAGEACQATGILSRATGYASTAGGNLSQAAGYQAHSYHNLAFIWSGRVGGSSTINTNEFAVDAPGGIRLVGRTAITGNLNITNGVLQTNGVDVVFGGGGGSTETVTAGAYITVATNASDYTVSLAADITNSIAANTAQTIAASNGVTSAFIANDTVVSNGVVSGYQAYGTAVSNAFIANDVVVSNGAVATAQAYTLSNGSTISNVLQSQINAAIVTNAANTLASNNNSATGSTHTVQIDSALATNVLNAAAITTINSNVFFKSDSTINFTANSVIGSAPTLTNNFATKAYVDASVANDYVFYLTTNKYINANITPTNNINLLKTTRNAAAGNNSILISSNDQYVASYIFTNQTFTKLNSSIAQVALYCNENGAGSGSIKPEIYYYNTVSNILVEFAPDTLPEAIPESATPSLVEWYVPYPDVMSDNPFWGVLKFKSSGLVATPTLQIASGAATPSHMSLNIPSTQSDAASVNGYTAAQLLNAANHTNVPAYARKDTTNTFVGNQTITGTLDVTGNLTAPTASIPDLTTSNITASGKMLLGSFNSATYPGSIAQGSFATASGDLSHSAGYHTTASGYGSHAEGGYTTAGGLYSRAQGYGSTASGDLSFAAGLNCTSSVDQAIALGYNATASNANSFVWSDGTVYSSTAEQQYSVKAAGGIRLDGDTAVTGELEAGTLKFAAGTNVVTSIIDYTDLLARPSFKAINSVDQSITNDVVTALNFDSEEWDSNNMFATNKLTIPVYGRWTLSAHTRFQEIDDGYYSDLQFTTNSVAITSSLNRMYSPATAASLTYGISYEGIFNTGTVIQVFGYHNSTNTFINASHTWFTATYKGE